MAILMAILALKRLEEEKKNLATQTCLIVRGGRGKQVKEILVFSL